jgi:hypothetical protein
VTIASTSENDVSSVKLLRIALSQAKPCIVVSGDFPLSEPLKIGPANAGLQLVASAARPARFVALGKVLRGIEVSRVPGVRLEGLRLSGFAMDGVFAFDTPRLLIRSLVVQNTLSSAWSEGAIHLTGRVVDSLIDQSTIDGADYAGIIVDTNSQSDVSGLRITRNTVRHSCRKVADCGAIYVSDRGRRSQRIVIAQNRIADFGPSVLGGRGIYLDDWASNATVSENRIAGPGRYAFQIHGGHHNLIERNRVDLSLIETTILNQPMDGEPREIMMGNVFSQNVFSYGSKDSIYDDRHVGLGAVTYRSNRLCTNSGCEVVP